MKSILKCRCNIYPDICVCVTDTFSTFAYDARLRRGPALCKQRSQPYAVQLRFSSVTVMTCSTLVALRKPAVQLILRALGSMYRMAGLNNPAKLSARPLTSPQAAAPAGVTGHNSTPGRAQRLPLGVSNGARRVLCELKRRVQRSGCAANESGAHAEVIAAESACARRDGLLIIPGSYDPALPSPLLVFLHGASASGANCESVFSR